MGHRLCEIRFWNYRARWSCSRSLLYHPQWLMIMSWHRLLYCMVNQVVVSLPGLEAALVLATSLLVVDWLLLGKLIVCYCIGLLAH